MFNFFLETQILNSIETARKETEYALKNASSSNPENELKNRISDNFSFINLCHRANGKDSAYVFVRDVRLDKKIQEKGKTANDHQFDKSKIGGALVLAGRPILKKRFVMAGSSAGTSIASKYFSSVLPQRMPIRMLGTRVLGRAIGRAIPYVGVALIAIDVIELLIEEGRTSNNYSGTSNSQSGGSFGGFEGGSFGGGGSKGSW